ncbi:recombinase family protein [Grimontia sp. NTOU-MAR1]|uniref:recombinase family protein n=1 Tax=Grimontia sp. NTOU-MAR1 TaxID=3111011 RepID=UPI002DC04FAB|nr:recombinase family protein [Grimontia sp. NTOU-MAR1]WRW00403.1 recombinase family protein [Grimontia sp. NTOU-MAR1]
MINQYEEKNLKIGYARVSSKWYQTELQLAKLERQGCDKIWRTNCDDKTKFKQDVDDFIEQLNKGDTVVATSLIAIAESKADILNLLSRLESKGAYFRSLKEPWCDTTPECKTPLLEVIRGVINFDLEISLMKQNDTVSPKDRSITLAVGRPSKLSENKKYEAICLLKEGKSAAAIGRLLGVSRSTISRLKRDFIPQKS